MHPKHFLIRYPKFCGITKGYDYWYEPEFYIRRDQSILPKDLQSPDEYCYEPFCEYEFNSGSAIRADMRRVFDWIKENHFDDDQDPINDEYEGWYWGEVPEGMRNNYTKAG